MPRLFIALEVPDAVASRLERLRGGVDGARWVERENYHLTLRFIGDVEAPVANELADALEDVRFPAFELMLSGLGAFGGTKPRALWAGVADSPELDALQGQIERLCRRLGLAPETRRFTPHVTLARLRKGARFDSVQRFIVRNNLYRSRPFTVSHFALMSSRPSKGGGPYSIEEAYDLIDYEDFSDFGDVADAM